MLLPSYIICLRFQPVIQSIYFKLYLLLVRIVPNTPIPLYINMFTTVLRTYTFILLSYFAFLLSFAFAFSLVYSQDEPKLKPGINLLDNDLLIWYLLGIKFWSV